MNKKEQEKEEMFFHSHPHEPFIKKDTTKIIVGTLPPPRFSKGELKQGDVNFCYGSIDGLLWKALDRIFSLNLQYENTKDEIKRRQDFLIKNKIGICDIVQSCEREKIDASDLGMKNIILRDILGYLRKYPKIDTIIFTGGNSKNGPEYFFRKVLKQEAIKFLQVSNEIPKVNKFNFENKEIKTISLTSPSNAANRFVGSNAHYKKRKAEDKSYNIFEFRVEQYAKVF